MTDLFDVLNAHHTMSELLQPASAGARPSIVGKYDEAGEWILPSTGELTPATIAGVIGKRLRQFHRCEHIDAVLDFLELAG